mgnify:CR=1 FL=1
MNIIPSRSNTLLAASAMLLLLSTAVHSVTVDDYYENIFACDVCNLQTLVVAAGVEDQTINVLAVNRVQEVWQSYEIFTDLVGESGQPMLGSKTITPVATPTELVAEIQDALNVVKDFKTYSVMTIPVGDLPLPPFGDDEILDSASDLIARPTISTAFENAVSDLQSGRIFDGIMVGGALQLINRLLADATGLITLTFEDGSSMEFELDRIVFDQSDNRFKLKYKRVEGSGRDSEGRPIQEDAGDFNGIVIDFDLPGGGPGLGEFVDLAGRLGVNISGLPSGGGGASCNIEMSCSFDSGGNMNCVASVSGC